MAEDFLDKADGSFSEFARTYRVKLCRNYREIPSRSLFWWDRGLLKFIQLRTHSADNYALWIAAYRLALPILNFWTIYLDLPSDFSKKLIEIKGSMRREELLRWLEEAKEEIDRVGWKSVPSHHISATIRRSFLLPQNFASLILIVGIIIWLVSLTKSFFH